jgi:hypothetical protein
MINCLLLTIIALVIYDFMPIGLVVQIIDVGFLVEWKSNLSLLNVLPVRARFVLARLCLLIPDVHDAVLAYGSLKPILQFLDDWLILNYLFCLPPSLWARLAYVHGKHLHLFDEDWSDRSLLPVWSVFNWS